MVKRNEGLFLAWAVLTIALDAASASAWLGTGNPPLPSSPSLAGPKVNVLSAAEQVRGRSPNSKRWVVEFQSAGNGKPVKSSYVELASGLHYNAGTPGSPRFEDADPTLRPAKHGAEALALAHKVRFAARLALDRPTIQHWAENNLPLLSSPGLIVYRDLRTDRSVILAHVKPSALTFRGNTAVYPEAFDGIHADIRYTVRRESLEQDVLLYSKPPPPSAFGLNGDSTVLAVLTRLFHLEDHAGIDRSIADESGRSILKGTGNGLKGLKTSPTAGPIIFESNRIPALRFARSYFASEDDSPNNRETVRKRLVTIQGKHFLSEEIPAAKVFASSLPFSGAVDSRVAARPFENLEVAPDSNDPAAPTDRLAHADIARGKTPLVLDYIAVAGGVIAQDFVFKSGQTYLISGPTVMTGKVSIEGGTVIKFAEPETGAHLELADAVFATTSSSWAIFTSKHDDSVGDIINGSTGNPASANFYANALTLAKGSVRFAQFRYASSAIDFRGQGPLSLRDSAFFAVGAPLLAVADTGPMTVDLQNLLVVYSTQGPIFIDNGNRALSVTASNLTVSQLTGPAFDARLTASGSSLKVTDSLFANVRGTKVFSGTQPRTEDYNAFYSTPQTGSGIRDRVLSTDPLLTDLFLDQASPLINSGSRLASEAGLYHYSTDPERTVEGVSQVDIGYHWPPDLNGFSVFAEKSVLLKKGSVIVSGNVGVNQPAAKRRDDSKEGLTVGEGVKTDAGIALFADRVRVREKAVVHGKVYTNRLDGKGTVAGPLFMPLPLPLLDAMPPFQPALLTGRPGDIKVRKGEFRVLEPGVYGAVDIQKNGTLALSGGEYHVRSIETDKEASLLFQGRGVVHVAEDLKTGKDSVIGPAPESGLDAFDVLFYVGAANAESDEDKDENKDEEEGRKAVRFGESNIVTGRFYAPYGTIWFRQGSRSSGVFVARDVVMAKNAGVAVNTGSAQLPRVAAPAISPLGGSFYDSVQVSMLTITSGAEIFYTTDGSAPTRNSTRYAGPFTLTTNPAPIPVKAIAVRDGYRDSASVSARFEVVPRPTTGMVFFSPDPAGGPFTGSTAVTLSSATSGAAIYYTLDGTAPTRASIRYAGPIALTKTATIAAFAVFPQYHDSPVTSATYKFPEGVVNPGIPVPTLGNTLVANLASGTDFLYTGNNPLQAGVAPGVIEPKRAAVVRGKVSTRDGSPLSGATVSVLNHPEFGYTATRADGNYDMAVNGGGRLTLNFGRPGFLPGQRSVQVPWQDFAIVDEIALVPLDQNATPVNLAGAAEPAVARGSLVADASGSRQSTLIFPAGTTAQMILPDGSSQPLASLNVRATEYTVGPGGEKAMPARLPPNTGYTYAVEFSVDEAVAAGASSVNFSQPVPAYVENFLNFPAGTDVPSAYYDRAKGAWVPEDNGRVIKILGAANALADLDIDGSGVPAGATALSALGIGDGERQKLAALYAPGQSLWRVPVRHFSTFDWNFPLGFPQDFIDPQMPLAEVKLPPDKCSICNGSKIQVEGQILGEELPIAGTPYTLAYTSDRIKGYGTSTLKIPLTGSAAPASLKRIDLTIDVAGRRFNFTQPPAPNASFEFAWDGLDVYGRELSGTVFARVKIGYAYQAVYQGVKRFGGATTGVRFGPARTEILSEQEYTTPLKKFDLRRQGLGGWTLNVNHYYDPFGRVLYLGDGSRRSADSLNRIVTTVAGGNSTPQNPPPYGSDATQLNLFPSTNNVYLSETDFEGNVYFSTRGFIYKLRPDGSYVRIAGPSNAFFVSGIPMDGLSATAATAKLSPTGMIIDNQGNVVFSNSQFSTDPSHLIFRIDKNGIFRHIAGKLNGTGSFADGIPATEAWLRYGANLLAVDGEGNIYVGNYSLGKVRKIDANGIIATVAGGAGPLVEGAPATGVGIVPNAIAVDPQGNLYIASSFNNNSQMKIVKVGKDGRIVTFAGDGSNLLKDGVPALQTGFSEILGLKVDGEGNLYISGSGRIRKIGKDGIIHTIAGTGDPQAITTFSGDNVPAIAANINIATFDAGPDGSIYFSDTEQGRIRKIAVSLPGFSSGEIVIPSEDGAEVYVFDSNGRHLRTLNAATKAVLLTFSYDAEGRLASAADGDGNVASVQRDASGQLTGIVSPDGLVTALTVDAGGYLESAANPAGEKTLFAYTAQGLMTAMTDARQNAYAFGYDAGGRLLTDADPAGGSQTLERIDAKGGKYTVTHATAMGRVSSFSVEPLLTGGKDLRAAVDPSGLVTATLLDLDNSQTVTAPDGTATHIVPGADPRFGMQAPVTSLKTTTPAGLVSELAAVRAVTLTNKNDPFSLTAQTDTLDLNGRIFTSVFDRAALKITDSTPEDRQTVSFIDARGRIVQSRVPGLFDTGFAYDARGRLTGVTQGTGADLRASAIAYNAQGFVASIADPLGRAVAFAYDAAGRVVKQTLPDGRFISFSYDPNGNVSAISPPGRPAHSFQYTPVNLESEYAPPDTGLPERRTRFTYNLDKQLVRIVRPDGKTVSLDYDPGGRLATLTAPRGATQFVYDPMTGNLASIAAPDGGALAFAYDGPLLLTSSWTGAVAGSVGRTYDNDFRVVSRSVNGAHAVNFTYDKDSLLTGAGAETLTYDPANGLLTGTALGGVADTYSYNGFGETVSYQASYQGNALYSASFVRDPLGRIAQKTETVLGAAAVLDYAYDAAGRLAEVGKNGAVSATYAYDANGNRTGGGAVYDDQDRLLSRSGVTYAYTANGDLLSKTEGGATTAYDYDVLGNLLSVTLPGGGKIDYIVDGRNRRVGRKVNGTPVQGWLYKDGLNPIAELDGSGNVVSIFVYASKANVPDYLVKGGATYRIISDHLGSPRLAVDTTTGIVAQRMDYDVWGNVLADTNPGFQPFGFAGGLYDLATRLVRFGARDYDAATGRWTAKDPILFDGGDTNLYGYVVNDPVNFIDPDGEIVIAPFVAGALAGAGLELGAQLLANGGNPGCVDLGAVAREAVIGASLGGAGQIFARTKTLGGAIQKLLNGADFRTGSGFRLGVGDVRKEAVRGSKNLLGFRKFPGKEERAVIRFGLPGKNNKIDLLDLGPKL